MSEEQVKQEEVVEEIETIVDGEANEEQEVPAWLHQEDDSEGGDNVPLAVHLDKKNKLKGQISERNDEIEQLKAEVESLRNKQTPQKPESLKMPTLEEHDHDEDRYQEAMAKWSQDVAEQTFGSIAQTEEQKRKAQAEVERVQADVKANYERAQKLINENSIKPEVYQEADRAVRGAVENAFPNAGDKTVDALISLVGDGSEKVMFYLGRNQAALNQFQSLLINDPSGLRASVFLGSLKEKVNGTVRKRSQAPAPAPDAQGGTGGADVVVDEPSMMKKYNKLMGEGKNGEAFKILRSGRKAGFDVKKW